MSLTQEQLDGIAKRLELKSIVQERDEFYCTRQVPAGGTIGRWRPNFYMSKWDQKYPWLRDHEHAEGPWCWVLQDVRPLPTPIPWRGAQGLWEMPEGVL